MSEHRESPSSGPSAPLDPTRKPDGDATAQRPKEIGGPKGLEPTRYGDWEKAGRCIDF
jgi:shikimate dehydrogenase